MGNFKSKFREEKSDPVVAIPQVIMPKIYENTRQVIYSYLFPKELLKVASLSYRERQTVINSKIVKENRQDGVCLANLIVFFSKDDPLMWHYKDY
jgi:hypothetical protein